MQSDPGQQLTGAAGWSEISSARFPLLCWLEALVKSKWGKLGRVTLEELGDE